jgi:ankyrin repeat protein
MKTRVLKIPIAFFLVSTTCAGQSSFQEITPGTSTRSNLKSVLGQPVRTMSANVFEFNPAPVQEKKPQTQDRKSDRRKNAGLDATDEYDRTLLMRAAARGDLVAAKELLARGADVNAKNADDYTALMYGAFYGNAEIVEFLLDNGAEVNARHKSGITALIEAAKQNMDAGDVIADYIGTVEALLKKGADVSVRDKDGRTALMYAEKYGLRNKQEIVRLLRNAGAKE